MAYILKVPSAAGLVKLAPKNKTSSLRRRQIKRDILRTMNKWDFYRGAWERLLQQINNRNSFAQLQEKCLCGTVKCNSERLFSALMTEYESNLTSFQIVLFVHCIREPNLLMGEQEAERKLNNIFLSLPSFFAST